MSCHGRPSYKVFYWILINVYKSFKAVHTTKAELRVRLVLKMQQFKKAIKKLPKNCKLLEVEKIPKYSKTPFTQGVTNRNEMPTDSQPPSRKTSRLRQIALDIPQKYKPTGNKVEEGTKLHTDRRLWSAVLFVEPCRENPTIAAAPPRHGSNQRQLPTEILSFQRNMMFK